MIRLTIFTLLFSYLLVSQEVKESTLKVNYTHSVHLEDSPGIFQLNAFLTVNDKASLYELDFANKGDFIDEEDYGDGEDDNAKIAIRIRPKSNPVFFKILEDQTINYIQRINMKPFLIEDSVQVFKWTIKDDYKTILGYNCQKAVINYRGRNYVGYFTTEIPFNAGPWKFSGLPGTILEIKEENDVLNIVANKIVISNKHTVIDNPFKDEESISWDEYITKYRKKFDELNSYVDPNGTRVTIPKKNIEVYIED
jgi:GLPGLI family protein